MRGIASSWARWLVVVIASLFALALAVLAVSTLMASESDRYVALGDSYSSGIGTGSYTVSSSCGRSVHAYPYIVAEERPNTSLVFAACAGATTSSLLSSQLQSVTSDTDIITLTIGGNDIGFARLVTQCTLFNCATTLDSTRSELSSVLGPKLDSTYAAIRSAAPTATVVVLGYPRLFSSASCAGTDGFSSTERTRANQLLDAVDSLTAARATAAGFTYRSAIVAFTGHAVCSSSAWVNGLDRADLMESYHPNRSGNSLGYAPLVRSVVG